ncbi:MAG: protein kinase [Ruminococcus sp.]|nr:protein kinase [Ruminococcus sp.]
MADFKAIMAEIKQPLWDNWYIVGELGSGASGVVYRIEAKRENRTDVSALKVEPITLEDVLYTDPEKRASILEKKRQAAVNETSIMYKLKKCPYIVGYEDENIVKLENTEGYVLLIRMEYLTCLQDLVKRGGFNCSEANVLKLAMEIGSGIQAAHKQGVIHRDVKPANFFVSDDGTYKLGDFNISKSTVAARSFAGTEGYIAPEIYKAKQSVDNTYTKQADIYSFGICLYQLLNDFCFPFEDNCLAEEAIDKRMNGEPLPLPKNASPEFGRIILRACAYDPANRYQSMDEFLADLRNYSFTSGNPSAIPSMSTTNSMNSPYNNASSFNRQSAGSVPPVHNNFNRSVAQNPFSQAPSMPNGQFASKPSYPGGAAPQAAAPAPKKKSKLPVVLTILVLLAGAGGAGAFFLLRDGDEGSSKSSKHSVDHPENAEEFDGHYYMYFDSHMNWKDAEAFCVEKGGHLVSVNSKDEQKFIEELASDKSEFGVWIGAYRVKDDMDTWYWTDGTDFDFTDWANFEGYDGEVYKFPAEMQDKSYYAMMMNMEAFSELGTIDIVSGSWADFPNNGDGGDVSDMGFICEWQ